VIEEVVMTGVVPLTMPDELRRRAARMKEVPQQRARFRPGSWERALGFRPEACALLRDPRLTVDAPDSEDDRTVGRPILEAHLADLDLGDAGAVMSAFTLVVACGSGMTNTRSLRYTPLALEDPLRAAQQLADAVERLRDDDLAGAYDGFRLPGVGQSFATRWFALAGVRADRAWQPLILDTRVRSALEALGVPLVVFAGRRRSRAAAYEAYVRTLHAWADELRAENPWCRGQALEWLLSDHGRDGWGWR
jgi:hypothetical protein